MTGTIAMRRGLLLLLAGGVLVCGWTASVAIEVPKTQASPPPAQTPAPVSIAPSDETAFYERLQRVTHLRNLRGLGIANQVIDALARGQADSAVATLSPLAAAGNQQANIALVRIQHWCGRIVPARPPEPQTQIAKLGNELSAERAARAAGVIVAEAAFLPQARASCGKAVFDYRGIESRLRAAADAGDTVSAVELAQFVRDPKRRESMLQAAADKGSAPAMYALATTRLIGVQRAESTENVASIRLLLKQAGRTMPKAKLDLANCMALGCDGHPADAPGAAAFGLDAARDGEPVAYLSMVRMPWGARQPRAQLLAWQYFGDRLNEAGCMGEGYVAGALMLAQTIRTLEKDQDAKLIEQARAQAETLWRDNGERAMKEQGCTLE